ncbi:chitobiase/beta-hexosaminidase C-terminal domain-containing protein, partial [bacterium]|nr:chitobiase/beta-hexosaminidase C-terminal domain-containing protein [bacterium]
VAIFAWQSGENRIAHNLIHHIPYTAILATGRISRGQPGPGECSRTVRWHETPAEFRTWPWAKREPYLHARRNRIEFNDIHNAMETLGDGNCIYVSGTGTGNVVRGNYCHDCTGAYMNAIIRCDDDQHGTLIEGNICVRTGGHGEGFISKGDNDIINNIVADLRPVHKHRGYIVYPYGDITGSTVERNILFSRRKGQTLYTQGRGSSRRPDAPDIRTTHTDRNLYWCTADKAWAKKHLAAWRPKGVDVHSVAADPLFVDMARGDFRFRPDSPALKLGIQPLDARKAGLQEPYRTRLLGRILTTRIEPSGGVLEQPTTIAIACSAPDAQIRYTLDGTEPTAASPLYAEHFVLEQAATVRAKAFARDGTDFAGAVAQFLPPPQPIVEGFEGVAVGDTAPHATTSEDAKKAQYTARASDEQAATGTRSLKFTDGPGQQYPFNPHVYYRCRFDEGQMVGRFAIRLDAAAQFRYQWRHYEGGYHEGPTVFIAPGGKVQHDGKTLVTVPVGQWVRFEVSCGVGDDATGKYAMKVWRPGAKAPKVFDGLAHSPEFTRLDWVGFVPNDQRECVVYVDDIEVRPGK